MLSKILLSSLIFISSLADTFIVNKEHSSIKFGINYFKVTTVEGYFQDYLITFETNEDRSKILEIKGEIKTSSITTLDKKRDSHLKKSDFFDVKKFPLISFVSKQNIQLKLDVKQKLLVDLTIKETTKQVELELIYRGSRVDPWTKATGEYFSVSGNISRSEFRITWNKLIEGTNDFLIGDNVKIDIELESYHSNEKPAFSRFYKEKENYTVISSSKAKLDLPLSGRLITLNEKDKNSIPSEAKKENDLQTILATIFTSFLIFIPLIIAAIFFQKKLSQILEEKGFSDTFTYIIPSSIIMIILIIIFYFTGPFMGHGRNPILDIFN